MDGIKDNPIGMFDSGLGGVSCLGHAKKTYRNSPMLTKDT